MSKQNEWTRLLTGLRILGVCLVVGIMGACGGGGSSGGGGGGTPPDGGGDSGLTNRRPTGPGTISGIAHDGPLAGATINVYEWNGQRGRLLAATDTDTAGRYSVRLSVPQQPVLLEAMGGAYVEEATESSVTIPSGQTLLAVQNYDPGQAVIGNITYFSTLAAGLAESHVKQGSPADAAVKTANMRIADILGLDLSRPPAVVNNRLGAADTTASVELGFATAAVSSLTQSVSIANNTPFPTVINSIGFIQAAYDDIRTDGMLDGRGANGLIALGKVRVTSDTYRRQLALNILKTASNPTANRLQVTPSQLVTVATRLNNSTDPVFANAPVIPIDIDKPNILDLSIGDGEVLFGRDRKIAFSVQSLAALKSVQLLLNDTVAIDMADPNAMSAGLDTTRFPDGQFDFTLVATDVADASARRTFKVTINNTTATVVSTTLKDNQFSSGVLEAQFSINAPAGIGMVQYLVDDVVQQTLTTAGPFSFDTRKFADGPHIVTAKVTDVPGAVTQSTPITINIDNTPPTATFSLADNTVTNQGVLNLMISATDAVFDMPKLPDFAIPAALLVDGMNNPTPPTDISVAGNSVTFNQPLAAIPDGLHTFSFTVSDAAMNSMIVSRRITLDRTGPVAVFTSPTTCFSTSTSPISNSCSAANATTVSGTVTFTGSLKDLSPIAGITGANLRFFLASGLGNNLLLSVSLPPLMPDGSFSIDVDTRGVQNGTISFTVSAFDALGNTGTGGNVGFLNIAN